MLRSLLYVGALLASRTFAQTFTKCNPLEKQCPDDQALGTTYNETWTSASTEFHGDFWNVTGGNNLISFGKSGAALTLVESGDSVTVESNFYIMWGTVEILMKAAPGQGIISTIVLLSDDLDEIDVEIMGGNHSFVETNYYGHGNRSQEFAEYHPLDGPQDDFHNYTIVWGQDKVDWLANGALVRSIPYARSGLYPQTPSQIKFGVWAAGDKGQPEGTVKWAGGATDWSKGPFSMYVESIKITDGNTNVTTYSYGDHSGSFESIKTTPGLSKAYQAIHRQSSAEKAAARWNNLSTGAKIGILCGVLGVLAILTVVFCIFCFRQRKQGRAERAAADQAWNQQQAELMAYRQRMNKNGFAKLNMGHGEKHY